MADTVLAAQLYTIREHMKVPADMAVSLKKIKEIGYDAVQLSGQGEVDVKELAQMVKDAGLVVAATHVSFDKLYDETDAMIEHHQILECANPAIGGLPGQYRDTKEGVLEFAQKADEVGGKLAAAGLRFGYHNHSFEFVKFDGELMLDLIFNNTDPAHLSAEIDTYWVQYGGGSPVEWCKKLKGRLPLLHIKEYGIIGNQVTMVPVGAGNLNWKKIVKAAKKSGTEWFIIEQDTCQIDPFESLKQSLDYLVDL